LKSKWLDGKHNRRIDELIYVLLNDLLPDTEDRHKWQELGMEGPDLAKERTNEILKCAPKFPWDRIEQVDEEHFRVRSSDQEQFYNVGFKDCNCKDFPHVKLCKHVATVQHYSGGGKHSAPPTQLGPAPYSQENGSAPQENIVNQENTAHHTASLIAAVGDLIALSCQLLTQAPSATPDLVKSVRSVRSHLSVVVSATSGGQLPKKEAIAPNQLSWPETAKRMGAKQGRKRQGKVNSALSAQLISEVNRKRKCTDQDPYSGGEHSGKCAKPDARLVVANTQARATAEPVPAPASLPVSLPAPLPSSHAALCTAPTDALRYTSVQPLSLLQPALASFTYIPQPYMHLPYPVPMYYPPPPTYHLT
jgi:hypothetical protein